MKSILPLPLAILLALSILTGNLLASPFSLDKVEMIEAMDDKAEFTAGDKPVFVFGFDKPAAALDLTDPDRPAILRGVSFHHEGAFAIYLQVPAGTEVGVYKAQVAGAIYWEKRLEQIRERRRILRELREEAKNLVWLLSQDYQAEILLADFPRHIQRYGEARFTGFVEALRLRFRPKAPKVPGMVIVESERGFDETWETLVGALDANPNIRIVTNINHAAAAESVGLDLPPNRIIVFGNPNLGTPLMVENQTTGIDLPQKIHVYEEQGITFLGFNDVTYLDARHDLGDQPTLDIIAGALRNFTTLATDTPNDIAERRNGKFRNPGLVTVASNAGIDETWDRLLAAIEASPANIAFTVDHQAGADSVGLSLRPTRLVVFGNPNLGTPLMQEKPTIGIDLPLKILVWESADGETFVTTNDINFLAWRHRIRRADLAPISGAIGNFLQVAAGN